MGEKLDDFKKKTVEGISQEKQDKIKNMSAYMLPDRPSQQGMKPDQIKKRFWEPIIKSDLSAISEVNRVVGEVNKVNQAAGEAMDELSDQIYAENEINIDQNVAIEALKEDLGDVEGLSEEIKAESLVEAINGFLAKYKEKVGTLEGKDTDLGNSINDLSGSHNALSNLVGSGTFNPSQTSKTTVVAVLSELLTRVIGNESTYAKTTDVANNYITNQSGGGEQTVQTDLTVTGNLTVMGETYAQDIQSLEVKDAFIVTNSEGESTPTYSGLVIRLNDGKLYGILCDTVNDSLKLGELQQVDNGYQFITGEAQSLATRADDIDDGNIPMWNDTNKTFEDSGKAADKLVAVTQEIADGNLAKWNVAGHTFVDAGKPADKVALQDGAMVHGALPVWDSGKRAWVNSGKTPEMLQAVGSANVVANALKGRACGEIIRLDDVSTLSHMFDVELRTIDITKIDAIGSEETFDIEYQNDSVTVTSTGSATVYGIRFNPFEVGLGVGTYNFTAKSNEEFNESIYMRGWRVKYTNDQYSEPNHDYEIEVNITEEIAEMLFYAGTKKNSVTFSEIEITDKSTGKTYIFYHPDAIELYASGKNLITKVENMSLIQSFAVSEDGSSFTISSANGSNQLYGLLISVGSDVLKVDETYTFSIHCPKHADRWGWRVEYEDGTIATDLNGVTINLNQSETVSLTVQQQIKEIRFYLGQAYLCQEGESITLSEPQIEFGKEVTEFAPFAEMQTYTFNDSFKTSIPSIAPEALLFANDKGIVIDAKYNRDVNKAFAQLEARLSALEKGGEE